MWRNKIGLTTFPGLFFRCIFFAFYTDPAQYRYRRPNTDIFSAPFAPKMTVCRPNARVVNHLRVERTCSTRCMSNICCLTYQNLRLSLRKPSSGLIKLILLLLGLLGHTFTSSGSTLSLSLTGETTDENRNNKKSRQLVYRVAF